MHTTFVRNCFLLACISFFSAGLLAQSSNQNYIKTTVPINAVTTETALNSLSTSLKIEDITYFDGLGRPIQTVTKRASPLSKDVVQNAIYDQYGRVPRSYLPYVDNTVDGSYKTNATANQAGFYSATYLVAHTATPYADAVYDGSPLNKTVETSAPDADWQLAQHTTIIEEGTNITNEVRLWQITGGDCISTSFYAANQLSKVKVTDPNGGYSYTYTDKLGKTIMVQRYVRSISKTSHVFTYTYYVYDDFGNLAFVIPPRALELMTAPIPNFSVNALSQDLVFKYVYDERQRLIEKKVPGAAWQYLVYNQLNQPVLTQDGNLRALNKWQFIKYDVLGRAIMTGIFDASSLPLYQTRSSAQAQLNANQADIGESEVLQDVSNPYGYTNVTLPNQNIDILTVNFYDDYDFDNNGTADYSFNTASMPCITTGTVVCTPFTNSATNRTRGFLTGSKTKVLDAANPVQWLTAASFYNADGQVSQVQSNDHLGGSYLTNMRYDFSGNMIHSVISYTEVGSTVRQIINYFTYDKMGRLLRVDQKNDNDAPVVISKEKYNELGQLIDKSLHSTNNGGSFIQSVDYRYNIHGWLTHINNSDLSKDMDTDPDTGLPLSDGTNDDENDLWGMQLKYNAVTTGVNGTGNKQYGGNVSEKHWKAASDNVKRAYGYTYDKLDRLTSSTYTEYNYGTSAWGTNVNRFDENNITYDANGNILTLTRRGHQTASTFGQIDNLTYTYSGNVVTAINDASLIQSSNDFKDNGSSGSGEYAYDANGNMTNNANKQITSIAYNHMNLPTAIVFSSGDRIDYYYDATGTRIRKKMTQGASVTNKKYTGLFEYTDTGLEALYTSEGRCVPTGTVSPQYRYEYQYVDNTGNAVLAFSDLDGNGTVSASTEIIQQSHFYPFGMRMQGLSTPQIGPENKYKFGSKELQDEFGLNEYDFGARFYDPATGRWGCVDPLADLASDWTPFRYGFNNPITVTDPNGMFEEEQDPADGEPKNPDGITVTIVNKLEMKPIPYTYMYMDKIETMDLNKLSKDLGLKPVDPVEHSLTRGPDPDFIDYLAGAGDWYRDRGCYTAAAAVDMSYSGPDDLAKNINWFIFGERKNLQGHTIGKEEQVNTSFWAAISILSGPLEGLGEAVNVSQKGFRSFSAFKRAFGKAGKGFAWHHFVEQTPGNIAKFGPYRIHNINNLTKLEHGAGSIHAKVSGYYSSIQPRVTGSSTMTIRQWLSTQSFEAQYNFGIQALRQFGWPFFK